MPNSADSGLLVGYNIYGFDLRQLLWKQQYDQPEHQDILNIILKLLKVDLLHCEECLVRGCKVNCRTFVT